LFLKLSCRVEEGLKDFYLRNKKPACEKGKLAKLVSNLIPYPRKENLVLKQPGRFTDLLASSLLALPSHHPRGFPLTTVV